MILLSFAFSVSAQEKEARQIDAFGSLTCDDLISRLDILANEVNNLPKSKGYIIVYDLNSSEGKYIKYKFNSQGSLGPTNETILPMFAQSAYATDYMRKQMLYFRRYPKENFLFISGGYRELYTVELWLVPHGTMLKPTPTLTKMKYQKGKASGFCTDI